MRRSPAFATRHRPARRLAGGRAADAAQDLGGRARHDRQQQDGRDANGLGDVEQHLAEAVRLPLVARQRPRLGLRDELVGRVDEPERRGRASLERERVHRAR